jgi:putative FmdB family regulatory protein
MSPIYEYQCSSCGEEFEVLELRIKEAPTSQCPECRGLGWKVISRPGLFHMVFDPSAIHKLPNYYEREDQAAEHDERQRNLLKRPLPLPLPHDRGQGIRLYESDGLGKEPK